VQVVAVEGRRERKKRELRERIYQAARELFRVHGFEATTVEQIAEAADVAQATFFNHFQSKQAVLAEMTKEVLEHIEAVLQEQLARPGSVQERMRGFADQCASALGQWKGLAHNVLLELARSAARPGEAIPNVASIHAPFEVLVRKGQEKGEVRSDLEPAFVAELFVGGFTAMLSQWLNDPEYPIEKRMRQAAGLIGEAIRPTPRQRVRAARRR